jgi:hypothetical protein
VDGDPRQITGRNGNEKEMLFARVCGNLCDFFPVAGVNGDRKQPDRGIILPSLCNTLSICLVACISTTRICIDHASVYIWLIVWVRRDIHLRVQYMPNRTNLPASVETQYISVSNEPG